MNKADTLRWACEQEERRPHIRFILLVNSMSAEAERGDPLALAYIAEHGVPDDGWVLRGFDEQTRREVLCIPGVLLWQIRRDDESEVAV